MVIKMMAFRFFRFLVFSIVSIIFFISCSEQEQQIISKDDTDDDTQVVENEYEYINSWIYDNMDLYYYWNDNLPIQFENTLDPESFFKSLLFTYDETINPEGDRFSFISDNADELLAELSGESKSTGIQLRLFYKSSTSSEVIAQILYVIHNSPADVAGLVRGDIITKVNGVTLDDENYYNLLFEGNNFVFTLSEYQNGSFTELNKTVQVTSQIIQENPIYLDSVYDMSGIKVGYLVYNQFIPGPNDSESNDYDEELLAIFSSFKASGINELILDLRYNPGGYTTSAIRLASLIGIGVNSSSIFFEEEYNTELTQYLENNYGPEYFYEYFEDLPENIGGQINRIYILVSNYSASSSELVINGLKPYMDVILIGEQTYGKNVGSFTITDENSTENNWALQPIVMKAFNSLGQSDYTAGFTPDYEVYEPLDLIPIGDLQDPLLTQAAMAISGSSARIEKTTDKMIPAVIENTVTRKAVTMKLLNR